MPSYLVLLAPSANRVFGGSVAQLAAAELEVCLPDVANVRPVELAGVSYLGFSSDHLDARALARLSATLAVFEQRGDLLAPVAASADFVLDDDLITIPKYQGKTNEQFTRLLLNVTLSQVRRPEGERRVVLDPLCGRGTTLSCAWMLGYDAAGVEGDEKAVEAYAAFLKTYLRRKRIKHSADMAPVRRDGHTLGKRFDATLSANGQQLTVFTGDTRDSAMLFGKRRFDAIVTDAPYGVVHGSHSDVRGTFGKRDRSAAGLLKAAVPVWAGQLKHGGALGISWNTLGLGRDELIAVLADADLEPLDDAPWTRFEHRVDSSIHRDLVVARKA